jgi:two-component system OmpR family sensor kinase
MRSDPWLMAPRRPGPRPAALRQLPTTLAARLTLRLRLTLWYGALLGLSLAIFGTLLYFVIQVNLERQLDEALGLRANQIARSLSPGANGVLEAADVRPGQLRPLSVAEAIGPELYAQVYDDRAELIATSGSELPIDPELVLDALGGEASFASLPLGGGRIVRLLTLPVAVDGRAIGVVQVGDTLDAADATLHQVRTVLVLGSLAVLLVAGAGGLLLGSRALAPVRRVSDAARRIATTGEYDRRLPTQPADDEIGELVTTVNRLIQRVETSLEEQRQFLADTSHELRSPLTVIRANLSFLWRETDPETRAECLREAEAEAARMSRLVSDLLLLGQGQPGAFLQRAPLALGDVIAEVFDQARVLAGGKHVAFPDVEPLVVLADRDRVKQALWNLVENALRYTSEGGHVRLSLRRVDGWAELAVADDGPGIPEDHLPRIFERFYRMDRARTRATGGAGLGLAIVRHIAQAHGGTVDAESTIGVGSVFRMRLPILRAGAWPAPSGMPARSAEQAAKLREVSP